LLRQAPFAKTLRTSGRSPSSVRMNKQHPHEDVVRAAAAKAPKAEGKAPRSQTEHGAPEKSKS